MKVLPAIGTVIEANPLCIAVCFMNVRQTNNCCNFDVGQERTGR